MIFQKIVEICNMAAISETLFRGVRVRRLDDEGNSVMVYKVPVEVQLEYDPKVATLLYQIFFISQF